MGVNVRPMSVSSSDGNAFVECTGPMARASPPCLFSTPPHRAGGESPPPGTLTMTACACVEAAGAWAGMAPVPAPAPVPDGAAPGCFAPKLVCSVSHCPARRASAPRRGWPPAWRGLTASVPGADARRASAPVPTALPTEQLFVHGDHHDPFLGQVAAESARLAARRLRATGVHVQGQPFGQRVEQIPVENQRARRCRGHRSGRRSKPASRSRGSRGLWQTRPAQAPGHHQRRQVQAGFRLGGHPCSFAIPQSSAAGIYADRRVRRQGKTKGPRTTECGC